MHMHFCLLCKDDSLLIKMCTGAQVCATSCMCMDFCLLYSDELLVELSKCALPTCTCTDYCLQLSGNRSVENCTACIWMDM